MLDADLPVFVINLDSAKERLEKIARALHAKGIPFERVPAIDGRGLADPTQFVSTFSLLLRPKSFLPEEVGCWLSHRKVWQRIVKERIPLALVLEDDASPRVGFEELESVDLSGTPLDLLRVHVRVSDVEHSRGRWVRTGRCIAGRELCLQTRPKYLSTAYFLTLAGAQKLVSVRRMLAPVDNFTVWSAVAGVRQGFLLPNMFEAEADGHSTIGERSDRVPVGWRRHYTKLIRRHFLRHLDRRAVRRQLKELER